MLQLSVLHLLLERLTACSEARYRLRIGIFAYPTGIRHPHWGGVPSKYCHAVGYRKLEWCGYPMVKKFEDMFIRFDTIHEHDRQTDGHRMTA